MAWFDVCMSAFSVVERLENMFWIIEISNIWANKIVVDILNCVRAHAMYNVHVYMNSDDFIRKTAVWWGGSNSNNKKNAHASKYIDVNKIERPKLSNIVVDALTIR